MAKTYAEALAVLLKDQLVEIYCSADEGNQIHKSDWTATEMGLLHGYIRSASGDCLVVECTRAGKTGLVYINGFGIKVVTPVKDSVRVNDLFLGPRENKNVNK